MIRRLSGKSCWLDVEPVFSGRSADSIFGRQHTRSRINKLYLLAYLHTMALSFFISLFVTYTDIANRQTTNIFFVFLGIHSSDAREKKRKKKKNVWFLSLLLARSRRVLANLEERIQKFNDAAFFWPVENVPDT